MDLTFDPIIVPTAKRFHVSGRKPVRFESSYEITPKWHGLLMVRGALIRPAAALNPDIVIIYHWPFAIAKACRSGCAVGVT